MNLPALDLEIVQNMNFNGVNFSLANKKLFRCNFSFCNIHYCGGIFSLEECKFENCMFIMNPPLTYILSSIDPSYIKGKILEESGAFLEQIGANTEDVLFKYMKREHAEMLVNKGVVRIGTLHEYRKTDLYGNTIGDENEGKMSVFYDENWSNKDGTERPKFAEKFLKIDTTGSNVTVKINNCHWEEEIKSENHFIFCITLINDNMVRSSFGYDTTVIINKPNKFFEKISNELGSSTEYLGLAPCIYIDKQIPLHEDIGYHPAQIKSPEYKAQNELRAIWKTKDENIKPRILKLPEIAQYCRII